MWFSNGTLHYMKKNAKSDKPFSLNAHVRERLEMWDKNSKVNILKLNLHD